MNAIRVPQPAPSPPPDRIAIEFSEAEAQTLYHVAITNVGVPQAVEQYLPGTHFRVYDLLTRLASALRDVGVGAKK